MATTLVLGGARSGKTAYAQASAEAAAAKTGQSLSMIVTAQAFDEEMEARISRHQADRDARWITTEAPRDLTGAIAALVPGDIAVVDCLTLWLSNVMAAEVDVEATCAELVQTVQACRADLWLVSNEVGWGIVPENALARRFRDDAGRLHQALARVTDEVVLVVAGLPLALKSAAE